MAWKSYPRHAMRWHPAGMLPKPPRVPARLVLSACLAAALLFVGHTYADEPSRGHPSGHPQPAIQPAGKIVLTVGKPRLLALKSTPLRFQNDDSTIVEFKMFGSSGRDYALSGLRSGTSTLTLWFIDGHKPLSYLIEVQGAAPAAATPPITQIHHASSAAQPPQSDPPPAPVDESKNKLNRYIGGFIDAEIPLEMVVTRPRVMTLKEEPLRVQVGDEKLLSCAMIGKGQRELQLKGEQVGSTVLNLWFGPADDLKSQTVLSFLVTIVPDPSVKERAREQRMRTCNTLQEE